MKTYNSIGVVINCSCGTQNEFSDIPINIDGILAFGDPHHCSSCRKQLLPRHIDYTDNDSLEFFVFNSDYDVVVLRDEIRIPVE